MAFTQVTRSTDTINTGFGRFNTLIDDLLAITSGKGASQIGIEDSAGNMAATNVETALAEIYTDTASTRTLADALDEDTAEVTGLTWGWKAALIRVDNSIVTVTASTLSLADDTTNYVEVNQTGTVSDNTTGFTTGRIPMRQITTSGGLQTVSTDKRSWFPLTPLIATFTSLSSSDYAAAAGSRIDLDNKWLRFGGSNVDNAGSAAGVFLGLDSDYTFYMGDASNDFIMHDSDTFSVGATTALSFETGGTERIACDADGIISSSGQPAFSLSFSAVTIVNLSTDYTVPWVVGNEDYDVGDNLNADDNKLTFPVDGKYLLTVMINLATCDSAASSYQVKIITSNETYFHLFIPSDILNQDGMVVTDFSVVADCDADDTCFIKVRQTGGTGNQTNVSASAYSWFSGCKLT